MAKQMESHDKYRLVNSPVGERNTVNAKGRCKGLTKFLTGMASTPRRIEVGPVSFPFDVLEIFFLGLFGKCYPFAERVTK